jgi:hypothetical protein
LLQLPGWLPALDLFEAKAERLGGGVVRVTATALNRGYLPTMSDMGRINGEAYPLQMAIDVPQNVEILQGPLRMRMKRLEGRGGNEEKTWLLRYSDEPPAEIKLKLWAPAIGNVERTVQVKKAEAKQ